MLAFCLQVAFLLRPGVARLMEIESQLQMQQMYQAAQHSVLRRLFTSAQAQPQESPFVAFKSAAPILWDYFGGKEVVDHPSGRET